MVVFKIDIQGVFARPSEGDPVIPGDAHRPAFWVALQAVEALAFDDGSTKAPVQPAQSASEEQPDISGEVLSGEEETV